MAGPAIRAVAIARRLAEEHDVRLVSTKSADLPRDDFDVHYSADLMDDADWAEIAIVQGDVLAAHRHLAERTDLMIVADVYAPIHIEKLEETRGMSPSERRLTVFTSVDILNQQLERADLLLCASERQRLFWLGQLAGLGRLSPELYDEDESLRSLVAIVPFGLDPVPPEQKEHGLRGRVPGLSVDDKIVLWGGGIYNWFDPQTLVEAIARLAETHDDVRLVFMGSRHPNPDVPSSRAAIGARARAAELGVLDRSVFFLEEWVPFESRADFLLDANIGVSTHLDHLETTLSFRTRMLDYLWAGLPIVATAGDSFADLIAAEGFGEVVPAGEVEALAFAIERQLYEPGVAEAASKRIEQARDRFSWATALQPLVDFCREPTLSDARKASRTAFVLERARATEGRAVHATAEVDRLRERIGEMESTLAWRARGWLRR